MTRYLLALEKAGPRGTGLGMECLKRWSGSARLAARAVVGDGIAVAGDGLALGRDVGLAGFGRLEHGDGAVLGRLEIGGHVVGHEVDEDEAVVLAAIAVAALDHRRRRDAGGVRERGGLGVDRAGVHGFGFLLAPCKSESGGEGKREAAPNEIMLHSEIAIAARMDEVNSISVTIRHFCTLSTLPA